MFGALRRAAGLKVAKSTFDSAFDHALALPISTQKSVAEKVKKRMQETLSDDPAVLEQKLAALNHQAKLMRQTLVQHGLATNQSNPDWLEAALLESIAIAGLSGDRGLSEHVMASITAWIKKLGV